MNRDHLYAFYGSLREGMSNHRRYQHGIELVFTETITGYRLQALRHFPYAVRTGSAEDRIVVEICKVTDPGIEQSIHELEMSVGYYYDEVEIRGQRVGIYLYPESGAEPLVKDGDWVKFFGSR